MTSARWCETHRCVVEDLMDTLWCPAGHCPQEWWVVDVSLARSDPHWWLYKKTRANLESAPWIELMVKELRIELHPESAAEISADEAKVGTLAEQIARRKERQRERKRREKAKRLARAATPLETTL